MTKLNFDFIVNSETAVRKIKEFEKEIANVGKVIEEENKQIDTFDAELLKMCSNLDLYFNKLLRKSEDLNSMLQFGRIELNSPSVKLDSSSVQQLDGLRIKNTELTEQIRKQREEIIQQKKVWNDLAEIIKSKDISILADYKQAIISSSDVVKMAKSELKGLSKELSENICYYDKLAIQSVAYKEELVKLQDAQAKGISRIVIGENNSSVPINDEIEKLKTNLQGISENQKGISSEITTQRQRQIELNETIEQEEQKYLSISTLLMNARAQILQMRAAGLQNTVQYQQASEELGRIANQVKLVNAELAYMSNPDKNILVLKTGLQGLADSANLVVGVLELVNLKSEEMAQIQTKVQALLGVIVGLENTYNMAKKSSVLMLAVEGFQRKIGIAAMALETKAKERNIALTWGEVAAQKAFNIVAKANPYVLLAVAMMSVVGGISLLISATKKSTEEATKQKERLAEEQQLRKNAAESVASQLSEYKRLQSEYNSLNGSIDRQKKFIKDNQLDFQQLGVSIKGVNDAENLFVKNERIFVDSLRHRALATAAMAQMQEEYKKVVDKMIEADDLSKLGSDDSKKTATEITNTYIASLLKQKGVIKSTESAGSYIDVIRSGNKGNNKELQGKNVDWVKEYNRYYKNQLLMLAGAEAADRFNQETEESKKKIQQLSDIVRKETQAADKVLQDGDIKKYNKNDKKKDTTAEELYKEQERYRVFGEKQKVAKSRAEEDIANEKEQIEINKLQEGSDKIVRQRKLNHEKELQMIRREAEDKKNAIIAADKADFEANPDNKNKPFNENTSRMSESIKKQFVDIDNIRKQKEDAANVVYTRGDDLKDLLEKYQDFTDRRLAIEEEFNEDIKLLDTQRKVASDNENMEQVEQIDRSKVEAEKRKKINLSSVAIDEFKAAIDWSNLFGNLDILSGSALDNLRNKLKKFIETAAGQLTPEDMKILSEAMTEIDLTIADKLPYKALKSGLSDYKIATEEAANVQMKLNRLETEGREGTAEYKEATRELTEAQRKKNDSLKSMTQAANNIGEKGLQVVTVGNDIVGMLDSLGIEISDSISGVLDGVGQIMSSMASIDLMKPMSILTGIIGAFAGIGKTIGSLFSKDGKKEKNIQRMQMQVDALEKSYERLGESIEKAYSTDTSKLIGQQNEMLEQQKVLIQNQIAEERSKKHSDNGKIQEYQERLDAIDKQIGENKEKAKDAIFGEDLKSAIENFAQAYADAWASGGDKAKSAKDVVKDMMRQMVTESIKAAIQSSRGMEAIRNKLQEFYADNVLSGWEQSYIYNMADNLQKELDSKFGWADSLMKDDEEATTQDSTRGGFESMSQETGTELNGRFTALQTSNEEIKNSMLLALGNLSVLCTTASDGNILLTEMRNLAVMSNSHLEDIARYTKPILGFGEKLDKIERNTANL